MALTSAKPREFLADVPTIDQRMYVAPAVQIYAGSYLEFASGAVSPVSGAGTFAGIALETALGGAVDTDVTCLVRVQGAIRVAVTTDTTSTGIIGVAATVPEATDDDTVRIETGAAITGTAMGKFLNALLPHGAGGVVDISFKAAHIS